MTSKLLFALLFIFSLNSAQIVDIPDPNFKSYLIGNTDINTNGDGEIQISEANSFTGFIDCASKMITNLTGIEAFTQLTSLYCYDNQITVLDLSKNINLIYLYCSSNQITDINLSKNIALEYVNCESNKLTNIDVSNNKNLYYLSCGGNLLSNLDVSQNSLLIDLIFPHNQISNIDVSKNTFLKNLFCYSNRINTLELSQNTSLKFLSSYANQLTSLDVSKNTELAELVCAQNLLTNLDLSKNINLKYLNCSENKLNNLNLKNGNNSIIDKMFSDYNTNLNCIQVDNIQNANSYVSSGKWIKDSTTSFSINCLLSSSENSKDKIKLFPNPTKNIVNLSVKSNVALYNNLGQKIISQKETNLIDLSKFPVGVYIVTVFDQNGIEIQRNKLIKE